MHLQERIDRLNDPVTIKFERDGLIQTYKKRVAELEDLCLQVEARR